MNQCLMFENIFHPSDFTQTSQVAFCHALKIALAVNAEMKLLHVATDHARSHHRDFPSVRSVLERWRVLPTGSSRRAVGRLGIDVEKTILHDRNPVETIFEFLRDFPSSLIVLAAHRRASMSPFGHSKAEPIARAAGVTTLFVPDGIDGFVSPETGEVHLKNILVPVALHPSCAPTLESIEQLVSRLGIEAANTHVLYVGPESTLPAIPAGAFKHLQMHTHVRQGDIVQGILRASQEFEADLVAMTTDGHHGFLDALRGNTTEQVLRQITCPLWAVTAD